MLSLEPLPFLSGNPLLPTVSEGVTGVLGVLAMFLVAAVVLGFIVWKIRSPRSTSRGASNRRMRRFKKSELNLSDAQGGSGSEN